MAQTKPILPPMWFFLFRLTSFCKVSKYFRLLKKVFQSSLPFIVLSKNIKIRKQRQNLYMNNKIHDVHMINPMQTMHLHKGIPLKMVHTMSASMAAFWVSNISWIFCLFIFWSSFSLDFSRFPTTASVCSINSQGQSNAKFSLLNYMTRIEETTSSK